MKIYSFSVKEQKELELVKAIKRRAAITGLSFSFIVLQALRAQEELDERDN
jgi:hypothetical protein